MTIVVATTSCTAGVDKARNIEQAFKLIDQAANQGADWILLPEVFTFHGPYDQLHAAAEPEHGPLYQRLAECAKHYKVVLFAGSFAVLPEESSADRVYNRMYVFDRDGKEITQYTKTHLFNLYNAKGEPLYCESDGYIPGDLPVVTEIDGFRVGLTICYDLRFSGLYQRLVRDKPVDILVNAAAFTKQTGQAHWEVLLRARSIEYQAYTIAANQVGEHSPGKESFGHSMIIDPWGEVLATTGAVSGIVTAEISRERLQQVRAQLPAIKNQRPELY